MLNLEMWRGKSFELNEIIEIFQFILNRTEKDISREDLNKLFDVLRLIKEKFRKTKIEPISGSKE